MTAVICFSIAPPVSDPGTFDGEKLHWAVPRVLTPLVPDTSSFASNQISMGIDGQLMEETAWRAWDHSLEDTGLMINISVPFGARGGYRKVRALPCTRA